MTPTRRPPAPAPSGHTEMTLEQVVADLRAAQAARAELAARVPTELLGQVLLARSEERA